MKTIYEKWIAANESLAKCYEQVPYEQYQSLSLQERETLCLEEKRSVQAYLNSGAGTVIVNVLPYLGDIAKTLNF